ncbi:hypothetical protein [Acidovorax sp. SUPP3334]|uniref:hypothetical protein n=1 Tax=Acidovorax sp. SUPP3334 TaxID=2920881 RepID=UPI0023DE299B|nr:hypothetical protein [Acidovorax sp. SUPP3334]GKT21653.1 hypothetical protein AVHM3334_05535 [Acidovorax sp. SUPP3334]
MFDRTFTAVYWIAAAVASGWLAWVCFAHMPWPMAALVFPLALVTAAAALAPALAAVAGIVAAVAMAATALIRAVRRQRAA